MKPDKRHALALAFERGILTPDRASLFCNAQLLPDINANQFEALTCIQGHRTAFNELQSAGYQVIPDIEEVSNVEQAIVLLGRNRKRNEFDIARLWNLLPLGGRLIVAGDKTDGVASIRKWLAGQISVSDSYSKYHAVVLWADKTTMEPVPEHKLEQVIDGFHLTHGMFSASGPDKGSIFLAEHFDKRLGGRVADLGAGWGYLSAKLLEQCPSVKQLDLYDADHASLKAAKQNLSRFSDAEISYAWLDITAEFSKTPYDWVIMNPPFHTGRASEPALGQRFIEIAASTLPSGGRLMMVANTNLPYERVVAQKFKTFENLGQRDGFKVLLAKK